MSRTFARCVCGAVTGCLPHGKRPEGVDLSVPQELIEKYKTCWQCGRQLDSTKVKTVNPPQPKPNPELDKFALLEVA